MDSCPSLKGRPAGNPPGYYVFALYDLIMFHAMSYIIIDITWSNIYIPA